MNQNQVSNPKTEVPMTTEMNDQDYLNAILASEKDLVNSYSYALNEASNDILSANLMTIFEETHLMQRTLFNLAFEKGWYALEKAEPNKIAQKYTEYQQKENQLPK